MTIRRDPGEAALPLNPPTLRLRSPADILGAIPYLIGYHPADAIVVMAMRGKDLKFSVRDHLPEPSASADGLSCSVERLVQTLRHHEATSVLIVAFGPDDRARPFGTTLWHACQRAGLTVQEVLRAENGRYWSYLCADPVCCPAEGVPYDVSTTTYAAQATFDGRVALPDRAAYEDQVKPVGGLTRIAMRQATVRADTRLLDLLARGADEAAVRDDFERAGRTAIDQAIKGQRRGSRLSDDEVAWLTVLLASIPIRDIAWGQITGAHDELERHRSLWLDVMRRAEPDLIPAPGSLFAFAAWRCGETTLARLALERVLDEQPTYGMATMIAQSLAHGLPPSVLKDWPGPGSAALNRSGLTQSARRRRRRSSSRRAGSPRE